MVRATSNEQLFIARVIADGEIRPALEAKITSEFFADEDVAEVWDWLLDYYAEYSGVPKSATLKREFPNFKLVKPSDPIEYFIDGLLERRRFELYAETVVAASSALDDRDLDAVGEALAQGMVRVGTETSGLRDTNIVDTWEERLERYEEWKKYRERGGMRGIPSGFPSIDKATLGFQEQQLVTFVGAPKSGKSTMMLLAAMNAHNAGHTVLFLTFEMSSEEQETRHDAFAAKVSLNSLMSGRLTPKEEKRLKKTLQRRRGMQPFIISSDIHSATTVSGVSAKIDQYRPDVIFIDGAYLMDDEMGADNEREKLTNLTRALKRLAQKQRIPMVISTQVLTWKLGKRKGITQDSIGYSSSFAQDSDVIIGVEGTEDEDIKKVKIVEARHAAQREAMIRWDWECGEFEEVGEYGGDPEDSEEEATEAEF